MLLSIIIPVYRTEQTLDRCVESITCQDFQDWELLLVDDGSPDNAPALCDAWAARDARIHAFHKPNGGLSDARNFGIQHSHGDYIAFVDSDDSIERGTLSAVISAIQHQPDCDIMEFSLTEADSSRVYATFNTADRTFPSALDWLAEHGLSHCWACNKIYRRQLFDNVRFRCGRTFEDVLLMADLLCLNPRIATTSHGRYLYTHNPGGIVASSHGLTQLLRAQMELVSQLGIDTRQHRWHRLYLDMFNVQLVCLRHDHKFSLPLHRIDFNVARSWKERCKILFLLLVDWS